MAELLGMSLQPQANRAKFENILQYMVTKTTKKKQNTLKERKNRGDLSNSCRVKCQWSEIRGDAFSSMAEVWDGGWRALRAVMVGGCLLRSLLKPILSLTAGGSGDCRRPGEETERKSMKLLETILLLGTTLTQLSYLSRSLYTSAWPLLSLLFPLSIEQCLSFCCPEPVSFLYFPPFSPSTVVLYEQQG